MGGCLGVRENVPKSSFILFIVFPYGRQSLINKKRSLRYDEDFKKAVGRWKKTFKRALEDEIQKNSTAAS